MSKDISPEAIAKARVQRLTVVRLSGVAVALVGAAVMAGKIDLPRLLGLMLVVIGVFDVVVFPPMLVRRWKRDDRGNKTP